MAAAGWASSPFVREVEPITATDEELQAILLEAELPPLLPALAYATGDLSLLRDDLRPDPALFGTPQGGLTDEQQARVRELALEVLADLRDGLRSATGEVPADAEVLQIMEHAVGGEAMGDYLPLLEEELAHRGADPRAPGWSLDEVAPGSDLSVLVVGAGMSGLLAAHRLQQAGVPFVVVEKNHDVGGTWLENAYPGCRVDNPNHSYSYSFAQRHDWPFHFSTQPVLLRYFQECADALDLRRHIRFGTSVESAVWSDEDERWTVTTLGPAGEREEHVVSAVISAVGQLNRPSLPDIPGVGTFAGPAFHSARWDPTVDLAGKRVAVIGTGASAVQLIPEIAPECAQLTVLQRTPPWLGPTEDYHEPVAEGLRWLYGHVPSYSEWNRFCIFWRMGDAALEPVKVDPDYPPTEVAVSEANAVAREGLVEYLRTMLEGRDDLFEKMLPDYPPGAKRLLRDNGVWPQTMLRDNVRLCTDGIARITPTGLVLETGEELEVDVLVYGTGFTASKFLTPMTVKGRGGLDLHEHWQGEARAYLGVAIPQFPNLFCIYGPNTNIVVNGSIIYFSECGVRYILGLLEQLARTGRPVEVRQEVHDAFNDEVDAGNALMAWGCSSVNTWYKTSSGHIAQNWPFTLLEYWQRTRTPDPAEYL